MRIAERLGLREDDLLDLAFDEEHGVLTIRPARLITAGTPAAEREERQAEADLRAGRTRVFESPEEYAKDLLDSSRKQRSERLPEESQTAVERIIEKGRVEEPEAVRRSSAPPTAACLVHMSGQGISLSVWRANQPMFTREIEIGGGDYAAARGTEPNIASNEIFAKVAVKAAVEVRETLKAVAEELPGTTVDSVFLSVDLPAFRGLGSWLALALDLPVKVLTPLAEVSAEAQQLVRLLDEATTRAEIPRVQPRFLKSSS